MTLAERRQVFTILLCELIQELFQRGYRVALGEVYRPKETAELYAKQGRGSKNSLHCDGLAADLNLYRDGVYLKKTEEYQEAGEIWEGLSVSDIQCSWGGRFGDGNHFSVSWLGKK